MVQDTLTATSSVQLQPLPNFEFAEPFIFVSLLIASVLAFIVASYFYKFYKVTRFAYLLGLVIGFSFITFSEVVLAVDVWINFNPEVFNLLFWLRLLSLSYGFSFIAFSYYDKHREETHVPFLMKTGAVSLAVLMIMISIVVILSSSFEFPPVTQVDEYFRVFNLIMLGYVFKSALSSIVEQGRKEFMYIPAAYALLWLGQYSALFFSLDGNVNAFIAQNVAKLIGFFLFVVVFFEIRRAKSVARKEIET